MRRTLRYIETENCLLAPAAPGAPFYEGGLVSPCTYPSFARHQRREYVIKKRSDIPAANIPDNAPDDTSDLLACQNGKPYVYGGVYVPHFGHFIAEFVHRLWVLGKPAYRDCTVIFILHQRKAVPRRFFAETLAYFGVKKWIVIDKPTRVEKLVIAEQGKILGHPVHPDYMEFLHSRAHLAGLLQPQKAGKDKILVMRGHMATRRLLCEEAFTEQLTHLGYKEIRPERLPVTEQLRTLATAEKIIISDGSTCHLFDLLPAVPAHIAFLGRQPLARLGDECIAPKVRSVVSFNQVVELIVPVGDNGKPQKSRALLFAPFNRIVDFLTKHNFIDASATVTKDMPYLSDLQSYLHRRGNGLSLPDLTSDAEVKHFAHHIYDRKSHPNLLWLKIKRQYRRIRDKIKGPR